MRTLTLVVGAVLSVVGVVGYAASGAASVTALIPTAFGLLLLLCGALARPGRARRHALHAAAAVALLGVLGSVSNALRIGDVVAGTAARPLAVVVSAVMFVVLLGYLVAAVRSFVQARRARVSAAS